MSKVIFTCWKCGKKFEMDDISYIMSKPICSHCGANQWDASLFRRICQRIGVGSMIIGPFLSIGPFIAGTEPSVSQFLFGIALTGVGWLIYAFSSTRPIDW